MVDAPLSLLLLVPLLLLASSFASSSETALFSLDRFHLRRLKERHGAAYGRIRTLLEHPTRLLVVLLLVNEIANLSIANVVTRVVVGFEGQLLDLVRSFGPVEDVQRMRKIVVTLVSMAVGTPIILFFAEITPKVMAARLNRLIATVNSRILILLYKGLYPMLWIIDAVIVSALRRVDSKGKSHLSKFVSPIDESDFVQLVEEAHKEGSLEPSEKRLIQKVLRLDDTTVADLMKPIAKAFMLDGQMSISDAMKEIRKEKYSRIPVYAKQRKNVVGVLYVKDLLHLRDDTSAGDPKVSELMAKPMIVAPSAHLSVLFRRFKKSKVHLAVVTDRAHNAVGIISLEDVLESIFGKIEDERDIE